MGFRQSRPRSTIYPLNLGSLRSPGDLVMSAVDSNYFDIEESGPVAIVRMNVATIRHPPQAQEFSADLTELVEKYKRTRIVINFQGTHYFGSSAFAALFSLAKRVNGLGGKLVVCEMDNDLLTGANILGLGTAATFAVTEAEALEAVKEEAS
jgi:anti-anti-sigma factor